MATLQELLAQKEALERQIEQDPAVGALPEANNWITIRPQGAIGFGELASVMLRKYFNHTIFPHRIRCKVILQSDLKL